MAIEVQWVETPDVYHGGGLPYIYDGRNDRVYVATTDTGHAMLAEAIGGEFEDRFYSGADIDGGSLSKKDIDLGRWDTDNNTPSYFYWWYHHHPELREAILKFFGSDYRMEDDKRFKLLDDSSKHVGATPPQTQRWLNELYPNEEHGIESDCLNPKCDYQFTEQDKDDMRVANGWFDCPKCGYVYNYLDHKEQYTRSGLTKDEMGEIGETIIERMGTVPGVGDIRQRFTQKRHPIDFIIGEYGVEVKTNHSQAQQRFKIGGEKVFDPDTEKFVQPREGKINYCTRNGLLPGLIGVRLNFKTDKADVFWRPALVDTWIGNPSLVHVGTEDFSDLNPFKYPDDVPPASELPDDDEDSIPF